MSQNEFKKKNICKHTTSKKEVRNWTNPKRTPPTEKAHL